MKVNWKKINWKVLSDIVEKKSFYIMVVLCVGIVVFSGLFISSSNILSSIGYERQYLQKENQYVTESNDTEEISKNNVLQDVVQNVNSKINEEVKIDSQKSAEKVKNTVKVINSSGNSPAKNKKRNSRKNIYTVNAISDHVVSASKILNENKITFEVPVYGQITTGFSGGKLIYSKTLNEWRSHEGIDIVASPGTQVKAVADGVIKEVKNDPRFGFTVIIEHNNNLKTVYASMAQNDMVSPNQKVKSGEHIGCLANTASFELLEPAHLHFEVIEKGKNINPLTYVPQLVCEICE